MMKKLLAFLLFALACLQAQAGITYACQCDNKGAATGGAHPACVDGNDTYNGQSRYPGFLDDGVTVNSAYGPKKTVAAIKTAFSTQTPTATSSTKLCRGGRWNGAVIANFRHTSATSGSPTIMEEYEPPWMPAGDTGSGGTVTYTQTTVCDTSKSWSTSENGGLGRFAGMDVVVNINTERNEVRQKLRIASNTATCLTLQSGPNAWSIYSLRFAVVPPAGNAYTIQGAEPELQSLANFSVSGMLGISPGTQTHGEGYYIRGISMIGHADGADVASITSSSGVVTVATVSDHLLTTGDLALVADVQCSGCQSGDTKAMLTSGASITVTGPRAFTYACATCLNGTGSSISGATMFYRKVAGRLISLGKDQDYITFDDVTINGGNVGLQADSSLVSNTYTPSALTNGLAEHLTITNSRIMNGGALPALITFPYTVITKTLFYKNGTTIYDHHLYLGGSGMRIMPTTMGTMSGNGVIGTGNFSTASTMVAGRHMVVTLTGATPSACNVTDALVTYVSPTQFTWPVAAGCNSTITGATVNMRIENNTVQSYVVRNTFVNGSVGSPGTCAGTAFVVHGNRKVLVITDNDMYEEVDTSDGRCWGISVADGPYGEPESPELFALTYIVGNRVSGLSLPISVDICENCIIESNFVVPSSNVTGMVAIRAPAKDYSNDASGYKTPFRNKNVHIRFNTVRFKVAQATSRGIQHSRGQSSIFNGGHSVVGNIVSFGTGWTTATGCFCTDCSNSGQANTGPLPVSSFVEFDRNICYGDGQGASKPAWNLGTLSGTARTTLALQQAVGFDLNSSATCDPWGGSPPNPTLANGFDLSITGSSCAKDFGGATPTKPKMGMFMRRRAAVDGLPDAGAFEANSLATPRMPASVMNVIGAAP